MKSADIVAKLAERIPLHTADFGSSIDITSIVPTATTALATTATVHGLSNGDTVGVIGAGAPVQISTGTFLRTLSQAAFETIQDHDLTLSQRDIAAGGKTITLSGATEAEFNGTFQLLSVVNRKKMIIAVDDSGATTISGSPIVDDANGGIFNGLFVISNVTASTFEYTLPASYSLPASGDPKLQLNIEIASALDIDQYLLDVYTKQIVGNNQLIVVLGDVAKSKNRTETTDASDSDAGQQNFSPTLIQSFAVYIIINATGSLTGADLRDKVEDSYIPAIFKSILRAGFDTGFAVSGYKSTFTGHGVYAYGDPNGKNKAIYVHEVAFEQLANLYASDAAGPVDNVAMRDIGYTIRNDLGAGVMLASIDLDKEPI